MNKPPFHALQTGRRRGSASSRFKKSVTLEQLMQAISVLDAIDPTQKEYLPSDPRRFERAYNFVRVCQKELKVLSKLEQQKEQARREQERMMDEYDNREKAPYEEVEASVCVPLSAVNKSLFWQVVLERANTDRSWARAKQKGIPTEEIESLRARYNELKLEHQKRVNTQNAQKQRKKTKKKRFQALDTLGKGQNDSR
jgi:hypothetical protein